MMLNTSSNEQVCCCCRWQQQHYGHVNVRTRVLPDMDMLAQIRHNVLVR